MADAEFGLKLLAGVCSVCKDHCCKRLLPTRATMASTTQQVKALMWKNAYEDLTVRLSRDVDQQDLEAMIKKILK